MATDKCQMINGKWIGLLPGTPQALLEFLSRQAVPERLHAVDDNHRNFVAVSLKQGGFALDVDFRERVEVRAVGGLDSRLRFLAEVAIRLGVKNDLSLCFQGHGVLVG